MLSRWVNPPSPPFSLRPRVVSDPEDKGGLGGFERSRKERRREMEYLSTNKIAIIDLATSKITDQELDEDLVKEKIGGAGVTTALYEQYQNEDPVVLGTGLLTGTLAPALALGMITAKSTFTR